MACPISFLLLTIGIQALAASGCLEIERNALLAFKEDLNDPRNRLASWESQNCCKWKGVVCSNTTGHILNLNLRNSYDNIDYFPCGKRPSALGGSIPSQIVQLGFLRVLDLSHNNLSGSIPQSIGKLGWKNGAPADHTVFFQYGSFEVFAGTVYLVVKGERREYSKLLYLLDFIDLSCNNLYGEIPDEIGDLGTMQHLNLSMNHLTGEIPEKIGMMQSLESLDVAMNKLYGTIPQSLATLNFLSHLNVSYNNLSGKIPSGYQLQTLDDPSIYIGNSFFCGPPTMQSCLSTEPVHIFSKGHRDQFERFWLFVGVVLGFIMGFWIFLGVLLKRSFRTAYFSAIDRTYDRLYVAVALTLIRLRRRRGEI